MRRWAGPHGSRSVLFAIVLTLVAGLALGWVAIRSTTEREETLRTSYASTATLVRDRLVAELARHEAELAALLDAQTVPRGEESARRWLQAAFAGRDWVSDPFLIHTTGGILTGDISLDWPPPPTDHRRLSPMVAELFREAERMEFTAANLDQSRHLYLRALQFSSDNATRAAARMRLGRVFYKLRQFEAGITQYRAVTAGARDLLDPTGVPLVVRALDQIAGGFDALGQEAQRDATRRELREAVLTRPWDLARGYEYYLQRSGAILDDGSAVDARSNRISDELAAIRWIRAHVASRVTPDVPAAEAIRRMVVARDNEPALIGWRPIRLAGDTEAGGVCGYRIRTAYLRGPLLERVLRTVDPGRDLTVDVLPSTAPANALAEARLHAGLGDWTVALFHRRGRSMQQLVARERWTYGGLVAGMLAVLVLGLGLAMRASARETELARLRTDFVANVSHELKTPLALIRLYAETLESGLVDDHVKGREFSAIIRRETDRLTHLIDNVLETARIEAGTKQYAFAPVDLVALTREALEAYRPFLLRLGFTVDVRLPDSSLHIAIDHDAVVQALVNLINNALKYSDSVRHLTIGLDTVDGDVRLSVTDRGVGIAASEVPHIFEKYYRVGGTAARAPAGSGLGLSIVSHAMAAHRGRVEVQSSPGEGSTFTLVFPAEAQCLES